VNRRELSRRYKETPRPMGVFAVRHVPSGRMLVGSSRDLPAMLNRQRFQLERGVHPNRALQQDWNTHGAESFAFETLDELRIPETPAYDPAADLATLEALWLEKLAPWGGRGYHGERPPGK
jgi:hypothetical protein